MISVPGNSPPKIAHWLHVPTTGPTSWMSSRATQWLEAVARVRSDVDVGAGAREARVRVEAGEDRVERADLR